MKTIAFVTQKGGAGKTTLAASLAVAAMQAGEKVALLDLDPQQSLFSWGESRDGDAPAYDTLDASTMHILPELLPKFAEKGFTLTILDTAGIDGVGTHEAMKAADLCLVPARPTTMDIRATKATHAAIIRLGRDFAFVLNQCPPNLKNSRSSEASSGLRLWGRLADPLIVQRTAHQDAFAAGLGVTEYEPDSKASEEIRNLWQWADDKMKENGNGKKTKTRLVG